MTRNESGRAAASKKRVDQEFGQVMRRTRREPVPPSSTRAGSTPPSLAGSKPDGSPRRTELRQAPAAVVPAFAPRSRFVDDVHEAVKVLITDNALRPGDTLPSEQALAEMFGVSKRVVREALRSLAAQGVVHTSQGRRAVVAELFPAAIEAYLNFMQRMDPRSALELHELREIVEVAATVLAACRATDDDTAKARAALDAMAKCGDDVAAYVEADLEFHNAIIDGAQNRFLSDVMRALSGALIAERKLGWELRGNVSIAPKAMMEHQAVLAAVEAGDGNQAREAIVALMATGRQDLERDGSARKRRK